MAATRISPWPAGVIRGVADVLGATEELTGSEIGDLLAQVRAPDPTPTLTKRHRLYNGLVDAQNRSKSANSTVRFIVEAMAPVRNRADPRVFVRRQQALNEVLIHHGLRINDEGKIARTQGAKTVSEGIERAGAIRSELRRRGTHDEVMRYCTDEILAKDNFHAVLEAAKSVPDRLRSMAGLVADGAAIIDATLSIGSGPLVAINPCKSDTDLSQQKGFTNLVKGVVGLYRNPTAHRPRLHNAISDDELLEALATISMLHRRLDDAVVTPLGSSA